MQPSEEIKEKINVVDLIGEQVVLKKAGVNYRGLCPFHHEKSPSFIVSPVKQIWHCFGCGLGGDIFEFVKQTEAVEFREALEILAARAGVELKRHEGPSYAPDKKKTLYDINNWAALYYAKILAESNSAGPARDYLQGRGLKPETIKTWQIGWAPEGYHAFEEFIVKKGYTKQEASDAGLLVKKDLPAGRQAAEYFDRFHARVMFPLFDMHGRVVGFCGRILDTAPLRQGSGGPAAKYVNSPETLIYSKSRLIYGLNFAKTEIRKKDAVVVVEGNVDVITCHEAGYRNVVGSSGTAFTASQLENLNRFTENISFALDADEAGLAATRRAVDMALAQGFNVKIISIPKSLAKDPDELIRKDPKLWEQQLQQAQNFLDFYFERVFATMDLQSNTGKKQAVRELVPLLSLLPDSIDRVHYAQKLAGAVGVDNKVIIDLLNKQLQQNQPRPAKGEASALAKPAPRKNKQELLEARVLGLLLKFPEEFAEEYRLLTISDFSVPAYQEIFRAIGEEITSHRFQLENILANYPKLASQIDLLVFALENEIALTPGLPTGQAGWNLEGLKKNFLSRFRFESIRRRMFALTAQIRSAEAAGQTEQVKNLSLEFNHLSIELSKYHVQS